MARRSWDIAWRNRPREEAALFNAAFCCELVARAAVDYDAARATALPIVFSFLIVPLVMHPGTRDILPGRASTAFGSWVVVHHDILVHVPDRVEKLRPVVREALLFGLQVGALRVDGGGLAVGDRPMRLGARLATTTDEADAMRRAAALLGRWFGAQPEPAAVLQGFGVRP